MHKVYGSGARVFLSICIKFILNVLCNKRIGSIDEIFVHCHKKKKTLSQD